MSNMPLQCHRHGIATSQRVGPLPAQHGPDAEQLTMFDEYGRARRAKSTDRCQLLEEMFKYIESKAPGSMLIAGTAGDGKTNPCRALWTRIGGDPKVWAARRT
jgi:hypothetical protein